MRISIEFCVVCHYESRATGLAAAIREVYPDAELELIPSGGGRFEVLLDGAPVYEKSKLGRHARGGEILSLITAHVTGK